MLAIAVQSKKSPLQIFGLFGLLTLALGGYLFFNSIHVSNNQFIEREVGAVATLSKESFMMFAYPDQTAKTFLTSHSFNGNNFKFIANSNRLALNETKRFEKSF